MQPAEPPPAHGSRSLLDPPPEDRDGTQRRAGVLPIGPLGVALPSAILSGPPRSMGQSVLLWGPV